MGKRTRPIIAGGVAAAVVAGGAGTAYAEMSSPGPAYRLATVASAEVTAALNEVGTVQPVSQADAAFAVSGPVNDVAAKAGQHVNAGQKLGSLDPTALKADLTSAQSALADANLQVNQDMASEDAATTGSGTPSGASGTPSDPASAQPGPPATSPASSLRPLQQAALAAQRQADRALATAKATLDQARQVCSSSSPRPTATPSSPGPSATPARTAPSGAGSPGPGTPADPSPSPTPSKTTHPAPAPTPATNPCTAATSRVLSAESTVLQDQQTLATKLTALAVALSGAMAKASQPSGGNSGTRGASPSGGTAGNGRNGGSGSPVSAAQLAADQASADAAAAEVTVAQQNLNAATLVSPISGTVVTVDVTTGSQASAGTTAFVIDGLDRYQVRTTVPVTDMPQLKVGQRVSVRADGLSAQLSGSVASIGLEPTGSGSPATYSVTIGLTGQPSGLHAGGYASVTITTAQGTGVSVPTSAVRGSGSSATVTVYAGGKTHTAHVTVGTRGPAMTRITSGLQVGQQVVLANLDEPLPTNSLSNQGPGPGLGARRAITGPGVAQVVGPR